MMVTRYIGYVLACQIYTLRLLLFWGHSFLVFLSKPGARIIVPMALFGLVYALRAPLDAAVGGQIDTLWQSVVTPILGTDLAGLTRPLNIEITAVALLLLLALVMMLLASMLQPVIGALWAPRMPLPPLPPMMVPQTEVRAVPVTRLLSPQRYAPLPDGLSSLSQGLPEELQTLLTTGEKPKEASAPMDRFARPLAAPQMGAAGAGQGMPQNVPPMPSARPAPPPSPPSKTRPPLQRPKGPGLS